MKAIHRHSQKGKEEREPMMARSSLSNGSGKPSLDQVPSGPNNGQHLRF